MVNPEESRIAIIENEQLINLAIETTSTGKIRGNNESPKPKMADGEPARRRLSKAGNTN